MQKKLVVSFGMIILFFLIILIVIGCNKQEEIDICNKRIGIIKIPKKMNKTEISYISSSLDIDKTVSVDVGGMSDAECKPIRYRDKLYIVCNDMLKKNVDSKLLTIDIKNKNYSLHNSEEYINDYYVDGDIYTISSKYDEKNISYIERIYTGAHQSEKFKLRISNIILTEIYAKDNYIYATGFNYDDVTLFSKFYIINKHTMNIEKEMDISNYIIDVSDMIMIDDYLYIGGRTKNNIHNEEVTNKELIRLNMKNYIFEKLYIGNNIGQFLVHNNTLYMSNYDAVLDKGNELYMHNIKDGKFDKYTMQDSIRDMIIKNNKLYILGKNTVSKYNIEINKDEKLRCIAEKKLDDEYISFMKN